MDWLLGKEHSGRFRRSDIKTIVKQHHLEMLDEEGRQRTDGTQSGLSRDELNIIKGAFDLREMTAREAMIGLDQVKKTKRRQREDERERERERERGSEREEGEGT